MSAFDNTKSDVSSRDRRMRSLGIAVCIAAIVVAAWIFKYYYLDWVPFPVQVISQDVTKPDEFAVDRGSPLTPEEVSALSEYFDEWGIRYRVDGQTLYVHRSLLIEEEEAPNILTNVDAQLRSQPND